MKSFKLKLLPENSRDGTISFNSVSSKEKSELYENVACQLNHRVLFCHPTTAADAGLIPLQPVTVQMCYVECNGKKISSKQPRSCFVVVTLVKLPQNIVFVSQEGIVQHLLLPCTCACSMLEHLSRARVAVRRVQRLVPAQSISFLPDFDYDSGVSRWTCHCVIMHKMGVKSAPYSGHPFLFSESSRIFMGHDLWKRYLTVMAVTPADEHPVYPALVLGHDGLYDAVSGAGAVEEDWENLFYEGNRGDCVGEDKNTTCGEGKVVPLNASKSGVGDVRKHSHSNSNDYINNHTGNFESNVKICKNIEIEKYFLGGTISVTEPHVQVDSFKKKHEKDLNIENKQISTSETINPERLSTSETPTPETPKSRCTTPKVFVHSISQSSFSTLQSPSSANETDQHFDNGSDEELTLYYITPETSIVLQSFGLIGDVAHPLSVDEQKVQYYYNPQVEVLTKKLATCLSLLQEIESPRCVKVKYGVVLHGAPELDLELMARHSAEQLGLCTVTALCDFSNKREVAKLYASARRKSPSLVLVQLANIFLCDTVDDKPNPAVPIFLSVMQAECESRRGVLTVCLCNKIERLSGKVRKALGLDLYNVLPDVGLRETIIRRFLQHKGLLIQPEEDENSCESLVRELGMERPRETGKNFAAKVSAVDGSSKRSTSNSVLSNIQDNQVRGASTTICVDKKGKISTAPKNDSAKTNGKENIAPKSEPLHPTDLKCSAGDVRALAQATEYCSCAEVHDIVHKKLVMEGGISGGLPENFVPHVIRINDRGSVPPTRWNDILGYSSLKSVFQRMVRQYREDPERYPLQGLMLYGPPGCGKTMFVKALATETSFSFFSVMGSVVLSKYVGQTEQLLRDAVQRAKAAAPSIVFIDELESLCGDRGSGSGGAPVALLLELMSSCAPTPQDPLTSVLFVGATNMPHLVDQGLLQSGYLTHVVHVGLPDCASRCTLWQRKLSRVKCKEDNIDTRLLCDLTRGFSGAEIRGVYDVAGHKVLRDYRERGCKKLVTQTVLVDTLRASSSRIPSSLLAAIDAFTASRTGVIEAS